MLKECIYIKKQLKRIYLFLDIEIKNVEYNLGWSDKLWSKCLVLSFLQIVANIWWTYPRGVWTELYTKTLWFIWLFYIIVTCSHTLFCTAFYKHLKPNVYKYLLTIYISFLVIRYAKPVFILEIEARNEGVCCN